MNYPSIAPSIIARTLLTIPIARTSCFFRINRVNIFQLIKIRILFETFLVIIL